MVQVATLQATAGQLVRVKEQKEVDQGEEKVKRRGAVVELNFPTDKLTQII